MTSDTMVLEISQNGMDRLDALWARGREFLGCRYAILGGAMTWVSEHRLVAAISNAGGFGVLATGGMSPEQLDAKIAATQDATDKPFGVNIILMHPQLAALTDVCTARAVGHVVLAGGLPKRDHIAQIKDGGAKAVGFAPALSIAKRLVGFGVDAIVIEGAEAGGHTGPVSTSVLAQEILPHMTDVPVFVAGGIGRGEAITMYLEMGAAGCQLGTRFVCATESIAHADFKRAFFRASARDAVLSIQLDPLFPVIPVRALANAGTKRFQEIQREAIDQFRSGSVDQIEAQLIIEKFWAGQLRAAVIDGDVENGSLMAGQSVGMVTVEQTTQDIIAELVEQSAAALE
jgi:enoyl-[acyl-carrier protein] reductase II